MTNRNIGEHLFLWRIENFSACTEGTEVYLRSPVIRAPDLDDSYWCVLMAPRGENDDGFISVKLCRSSEDHGPTDIRLKLELCLIDIEGTEQCNKLDLCTFSTDSSFGFLQFVMRNDIFQQKDTLLPNDVLTLQFRLWKSDRDKFIATRSVVQTKIIVERSTFLWTLRGLTGRASATENAIQIETKSVEKGMELTCKCCISTDEQETPGDKYLLRLAIKPKSEPGARIFMSGNVQIPDDHENPQNKIEFEHFFEAKSEVAWHLPNLVISDRMKSLMEEDRLDLSCEFSISDGTQDNQTEGSLIPLIDKFSLEDNTLLHDIGFVYESNINVDVMVKAYNGEKRFRAHKVILSARSTAFRLILENFDSAKKRYLAETGIDANNPMKPNEVRVANENMSVSVTNGIDYVEVLHVDTHILDQMLKCMYTDVLKPENFRKAMDLYSAGLKFDFKLLREKSEKYLISQISLKKLNEILVFAHSNCIAILKRECMNFITQNRDLILASDMWTSLRKDNGDLVLDISNILKS